MEQRTQPPVERADSGGELSKTASGSSHDVEKDVAHTSPSAKEGLTLEDENTPNAGVKQVEEFNRVLWRSGRKGKMLLWGLGISVMLTMFVYALDGSLTSKFFSIMATSTFGRHSDISTVGVASSIVGAVGRPFIGKMADITSRPTTYIIVVTL